MALVLSHLQYPLLFPLHSDLSRPSLSQSLHQSRSRCALHFTGIRHLPPPSSVVLIPGHCRRPVGLCPVTSAYANASSVRLESGGIEEPNEDTREGWGRLFNSVRSILPGGSWWNLSDRKDEGADAPRPVTVWRALGRMWMLVADDRWVILSAFSCLVVTATSQISIPHFLTASIFSAQSGDMMMFRRNLFLLVLFGILSGVGSGLRGFCFSIANMILVKRMRETLYAALLFQDISFFDASTVGDLTSRLGSDCQQVARVIGNDLNLISRNVLQGIGALVYLLILSRPLGLCTLAICSALSAIMIVYGRYMKKAARLIQEFTASSNEVAQETLSLVRTVRVYGTEEKELERYNMWLEKLAGVSLRQGASYGFWSVCFNTLYHSMQVAAVLLGGMSVLSGHLTAEKLTKFILYGEWLIYSTWWVGDNVASLMQSVGASEKVFQLMDLMPSDQFISEGSKLQKLTGNIDFVNVSFTYPSRDTVPVLQNFNISIKSNEVVALVGLSGSGKSTIVNLLLRLYEPTSGEILIDGFPIKEMDIKWLRERIGYVGQEPRLFRMDITSNIKYGCPRDVRQEDVEWAAKQAFAHDFISSLPDGYGTIVDDDLLSGGQKQRIAIARAILRDPTILILDEATSALDAESEHNIKGVLGAVRNDLQMKRTVIVIAHRLSTIQSADKIVVMDGGQLVETGSQKELLLKNGLYARLTRRQVDAFV